MKAKLLPVEPRITKPNLPVKNKKYLKHSWADPKLEIRPSKIKGQGIFTKQDINKGDVLIIWGGTVVQKQNIDFNKFNPQTLVPINDTSYLGLLASDKTRGIDEYLNHSCDANTWMLDEVTIVARRDIKAGEEITLDHATWDADEDWDYLCSEADDICKCGASDCRKTITAHDWKIPEVQEKYKGHFSPYIHQKINSL